MNSMKKVILPVIMSMFLVFTMMPAEAFAVSYEAVVDVNNADPVIVDTNVIARDTVNVVDGKGTVNGDVPSAGAGANEKGVQVKTTDGNEADVTVKGNVSANNVGVDASATGTNANTKVEVTKDVTSKKGFGVCAVASSSGNTTVNVSGDVTAEDSNGIYAHSYSKGTTTVNVDGDVTSYYGEYIVASIGTTTVKVGGDVTAKGENSYGMHINTAEGGKATVTAEDVTANGDGMAFTTYGEGSLVEAEVKNVTSTKGKGLVVVPEGGKTDILVDGTDKGDGTVKGYTNGILVQDNGNMGEFDITVWKIEKGKDGDFIKYQGQASDIEEVKKHVHYIVKLEPSDGADLSATKADGSLLNQYHDLDTALSGDKVLLKVNLLPGYQLDGAYNGDGEKVALQKDANGNYYVVVGDEGGIYLSVATSKTKHNISYNLDGGSYNGQIGTITEVYDYGTAIKLLGTPTREGYRFLYWRGSQYDAGADYTVEGDHLFTAVWEKISGGSDANDSHVAKTAAKASPATGDESELALWISIMTAAVLALVYTFVRRREYNR